MYWYEKDRIIEIQVIFWEKQTIFKEETEEGTIRKFMKMISCGNPDVIQCFNSVMLNFLFKKCQYYNIPFLSIMNRNFVSTPETFIRNRKPKGRDNITDNCYDYSPFSKESKEWNFVPQCHGRIVVSLWNHEKNRDLNPNDVLNTHRLCLNYLPILLEQSKYTGHWTNWNNNVLTATWCIKKHNKIHFPYYLSNQSIQRELFDGGYIIKFDRKAVYHSSDHVFIDNVDFPSFYMNIIQKYSLGINNVYDVQNLRDGLICVKIDKKDYYLNTKIPSALCNFNSIYN